jgi:hypothetical protein
MRGGTGTAKQLINADDGRHGRRMATPVKKHSVDDSCAVCGLTFVTTIVDEHGNKQVKSQYNLKYKIGAYVGKIRSLLPDFEPHTPGVCKKCVRLVERCDTLRQEIVKLKQILSASHAAIVASQPADVIIIRTPSKTRTKRCIADELDQHKVRVTQSAAPPLSTDSSDGRRPLHPRPTFIVNLNVHETIDLQTFQTPARAPVTQQKENKLPVRRKLQSSHVTTTASATSSSTTGSTHATTAPATGATPGDHGIQVSCKL